MTKLRLASSRAGAVVRRAMAAAGAVAGPAGPARPVGLSFLLMVAANAFGSPFLPVHARALLVPDAAALPWLSEEMAAGLPISVFWLAVAVAQLTTGAWERGRDHRVLLGLAMALATAGLALAGLSGHILALVLWRGVGGLGFGAAMILVQDHLIRALGPQARTRASGLYLSLFFSGTIGGTLAGGALAGAVGFSATLLAAAALSAAGMLLTRLGPPHREAPASRDFRTVAVLRNRRLLGLILFAAIPSRLINAGVVFYLIPLYLHDLGTAQGTIGWVVAIYSLILATTTNAWSRLIDRTGRPVLFTIAGALLSAAAVLVIPAGWSGLWGAAAAVTLLGIAQAAGMSPQVTVLFEIAAEEMERYGRTRLLGLYRVSERVGLFLGPMVAASLAGGLGYVPALAALAGLMGSAGAALVVIFRPRRPAGAKPPGPATEGGLA